MYIAVSQLFSSQAPQILRTAMHVLETNHNINFNINDDLRDFKW